MGVSQKIEKTISLIEQIPAQCELDDVPYLVPHLVRFLFGRSRKLKVANCLAIHRLLTSVSSEELLKCEVQFASWFMPRMWNTLKPTQIDTLVADELCRSSILGLASFHRNGYVRHEAIRLLTRIHDGSELPYLLIRQNDWVEPISTEAIAAVRDRLKEEYLPHFVRNLPLVVHLLELGRHDHVVVVEQIIEMLLRPEFREILTGVIHSSGRAVRRNVIKLSLNLPGEHRKRIIEQGLISEDTVLRIWCAREVHSIDSGESLKERLIQIKQDPFMPIRRVGFRLEANEFPESEQEIWTEALLDHNVSTRELAQIQLRKLGFLNSAQIYREVLNKQPDYVAALAGLGETGDSSDLPTVRLYLDAKIPYHRRTALRAFAKLGGVSVLEELIDRFQDDSPQVVREVKRQLQEHLHLIDGSRLLAIIKQDCRPHVRKNAIELIFEMSKWRSIPWLIRSLDCGDRSTEEQAENFIEAWFSPPRCNKVFTRPSDSEQQAIEQAIKNVRSHIDKSLIENCKIGWRVNR